MSRIALTRALVIAGGAALATVAVRADPPAQAVAHYEAGLAAKQAKDYAKAVQALKAALGMDEGYVDAHWVLAWVYAAQNDTAGAIEEFGRVVRLAPDTDRARQAQAALDRLRGPPKRPTQTGIVPVDGLWRGKGEDCNIEFLVDGGGVFVRALQGSVWFPTTPEAQAYTNSGFWDAEPLTPVTGGRFAPFEGSTRGEFVSPSKAQGTVVGPPNARIRHWTAEYAGPLPESAQPVSNGDLACLAIQLGDDGALRRLLADDPACFTWSDRLNRTLLHFAAAYSKAEIVALLAEHPTVRLDGRTNNADTALHLAAARGRADVVELLLDRPVGLNQPNNAGKTPLHLAAEGGHVEAVEALLRRGAEVNGGVAGDSTPLALALANGHAAVAELLREHGATE
ncbi:MAG: tetratricopeptide repeat protein [Armatimonadetes bacterium]|nr:tetratricopeptide repeat protein [Armatimonadota bacterium]